MFNSSGFYHQSDDDLPSDYDGILVKSCGHYKLLTRNRFDTVRTTGRRDYQLLYVADGTAHFQKGQTTYTVPKGGIVIYQPGEPQNYYYIRSEQPDIYWIHFSGKLAKDLLTDYGLNSRVPIQTDTQVSFSELFEQIIEELRFDRYLTAAMAEVRLRELLIRIARRQSQPNSTDHLSYNSTFDVVISQFNANYQREINISDYATSSNMSLSWFIREFKNYTGFSPKNYVTNLRIQHAKELLNNRSLSIGEVSTLIGYDSQLYFSRIFRKYTGLSPSKYRERLQF